MKNELAIEYLKQIESILIVAIHKEFEDARNKLNR